MKRHEGQAQPDTGAGARRGSLNLIHRTKVPNLMGMRVTARFEAEKGLPLECLTAPCPLSFLAGWRAGHGAKSTP